MLFCQQMSDECILCLGYLKHQNLKLHFATCESDGQLGLPLPVTHRKPSSSHSHCNSLVKALLKNRNSRQTNKKECNLSTLNPKGDTIQSQETDRDRIHVDSVFTTERQTEILPILKFPMLAEPNSPETAKSQMSLLTETISTEKNFSGHSVQTTLLTFWLN